METKFKIATTFLVIGIICFLVFYLIDSQVDENGIIQIDKNVRKRVKVFYDSEEIDNLYDIKFYLENIGNQVIKSEEIRFRFPEETRILDFSFDPEPVQEMKVERIETDLKSFEKKITNFFI